MENGFDQTTAQGDNKSAWDDKYRNNMGNKNKKPKRKRSKKGLIIVLIIVAAVGGLIAYGVSKAKSAVKAVTDAMGDGVLVEEFGKKDLSAYVDVTGVAESQKTEKIISTLQYPVKEIRVEVGDRVKAGDVVCTIDTTEIDKQIKDLEAQASDSERLKAKQLEMANHNVNSAASNRDRAISGANRNIDETKKDFENADADYYKKLEEYNQAVAEAEKIATNTDAVHSNPAVVAAKSALDAANEAWYVKEAAYKQATNSYDDTAASAEQSYQSAVDSAELESINNSSYSTLTTQLASYYKMKNDSVILSKTTGVVTSIDATVGLAPTGMIMTIQDDKNLEVNVGIKERDIFSVKKGMEVELSNSTLANVSGKGTVTKVDTFATEAPAVTTQTMQAAAAQDNTFNAKITITDNTDILLGMKLKVRIATGEELRTDAVPYTAILSDAEGDYVYVAQEIGNGMYSVVRKSVEKGMSGDYYTEIKSGDLVAGDKVICYPSTVTENGMIKINENSNSESSNTKGKGTDTDANKNSEE
ncbi:MAG: HlyD family efflux transporter periplasmic adaptor subunit [Eubacterium sp.]|nr:HlyD family efflux transporter periplasmic adaptor subunit [Eubacterium sp.]